MNLWALTMYGGIESKILSLYINDSKFDSYEKNC